MWWRLKEEGLLDEEDDKIKEDLILKRRNTFRSSIRRRLMGLGKKTTEATESDVGMMRFSEDDRDSHRRRMLGIRVKKTGFAMDEEDSDVKTPGYEEVMYDMKAKAEFERKRSLRQNGDLADVDLMQQTSFRSSFRRRLMGRGQNTAVTKGAREANTEGMVDRVSFRRQLMGLGGKETRVVQELTETESSLLPGSVRPRLMEAGESVGEETAAGAEGQVLRGVLNPNQRRVHLPVVSLYSARGDDGWVQQDDAMVWPGKQRKSLAAADSKRCRQQDLAASEEAAAGLSPASRERLDRLVRKLGPEALLSATAAVTRPSCITVQQHTRASNNDVHQTRSSSNSEQHTKYSSNSVQHTRTSSISQLHTRPPCNTLQYKRTLGVETVRLPANKRPRTQSIREPSSGGHQHQSQLSAPSHQSSSKNIPSSSSVDIHLAALFGAVEHGQLEKARTILEASEVDVNGVNSDGLSPLDVAVLLDHRKLAEMLISFGAQQGTEFSSGDCLLSHLKKLEKEANQRLSELGRGGSQTAVGGGQSGGGQTAAGSGSSQSEPRTLGLWQRRARGIANMISGFTQARPPDPPSKVDVEITGSQSVSVHFSDCPASGPLATKYKIEWSEEAEFGQLSGYRLITDLQQKDCTIDELRNGHKYFLRVRGGNLKGWGPPRRSSPASVTPSSWREVDKGRSPSLQGLSLLDKLFSEVRSSRPEIKPLQESNLNNERRKKTTIKQLFTAASKFQKHLRRGVYLSCLLYHEDKVLLTTEEFLPVIEVDETYPGSIYHDFHWLLKVACTWDDAKWLRQDMERLLSSPASHFRIRLLQAATQMQTALSTLDLGQLYHKPLRDSEGTLVICTVNRIRSVKSVSSLNCRWLSIGKLSKQRHLANLESDASLGDILMASIPEQISFHERSKVKLPRGLYLCYLKIRSCVDVLQVLVPAKTPNVPPHAKIRDNPHVTAEEWSGLTLKPSSAIVPGGGERQPKPLSGGDDDSHQTSATGDELPLSDEQHKFLSQVSTTLGRLFSYMQVSPDEALNHRLYDGEVVEVSHEVSLLLVMSPTESVCSSAAPGLTSHESLLNHSDLLPLPVQVFEMVHLGTYQSPLVTRYSRLSCIIELDTALAQHSHREAFSSSEVVAAKERLDRLEELQRQTNAVWKEARWLLEVLSFARDRAPASLVSTSLLRRLLHISPLTTASASVVSSTALRSSISTSHNGLVVPGGAAIKSRGSWPGPGSGGGGGGSGGGSSPHSGSGGRTLLGAASATQLSRSEHSLARNSSSPTHHQPLLLLASPSTDRRDERRLSRRLAGSKSEDTLNATAAGSQSTCSQTPAAGGSQSLSASVSPLLSIRSGYTSGSLYSLSSDDSGTGGGGTNCSPSSNKTATDQEAGATTAVPAPSPGVLQVYAAYETGLAAGTSLKIHVSPRTTAREVVDLVVKQLNMAVVLKGREGPIYPAEQLTDFCLVAVIGARERCLRDDFKPLQLQNPWKKGRLYVRQKHDVLAALEQSSRHSAYL